MAETTTVRVRASTRDELNAACAERGVPVEAVIRDGIALLRREQWRRQAEIDARAAAADPQARLGDLVGFLPLADMQRIDDALTGLLDLP